MNFNLDHRTKHKLDKPYKCKNFVIDDYVEYFQNGILRKGYIYCFRKFGYSWFAWIYFDKSEIQSMESVFVGDLKKIEG